MDSVGRPCCKYTTCAAKQHRHVERSGLETGSRGKSESGGDDLTTAGGGLGTRQMVGPQVSAVRRETEGTCHCGAPELRSCTRLPIAEVMDWAVAGSTSRPSVVPSDRVSTQQGTDVPGGRYHEYVPPSTVCTCEIRLHSTRVKCPNRKPEADEPGIRRKRCVRECIRHEPATWPIRRPLVMHLPLYEPDKSVSLGVSVADSVSRKQHLT